MTTVKSLAIIVLLVGGTSLAMAQNGPATGGLPPVGGGGTAWTRHYPSRRSSVELQSPVGGSDDESLVTYPYGASSANQAQKDVHVGKGPQSPKRQFALADNAQAIKLQTSS